MKTVFTLVANVNEYGCSYCNVIGVYKNESDAIDELNLRVQLAESEYSDKIEDEDNYVVERAANSFRLFEEGYQSNFSYSIHIYETELI